MIYDGINGYLKGNMNQAVGTILAQTKGPVTGVNWFSTNDPAYSITIIPSGATGAVELQGTNDVVLRENGNDLNPIGMDLLPSTTASWTTIATTSSTTSGTFSVGYEFLQLIISTEGTGTVLHAWVRWS